MTCKHGFPAPDEAQADIAEIEAENEKLKSDIREMIEKAARDHLPAYREQGDRILQLEEQLAEAQADAEFHKALIDEAQAEAQKVRATAERLWGEDWDVDMREGE